MTVERGVKQAGLAFGGNLLEPEHKVREAINAVGDLPRTRLLRVSSLYRTRPWGVEDQAPFINACALVMTSLPANGLLQACLGIERRLGRDRATGLRWGPRLIDIDILFYGNECHDGPDLVLPHPRMMERAFVLAPLMEIAPGLVLGGRPIADALAALGSSDVEKLPI